ncbi:MAG: M23 family metallopeptidase [Bacteroidota bacterium]
MPPPREDAPALFPGLLALSLLLLAGAWLGRATTATGPDTGAAYEEPAASPEAVPAAESVAPAETPDSARATVLFQIDPLPVPVVLPVAPDAAAPPAYPLLIPVVGTEPEDLVDTFADFRGDSTRIHRALDILAPTGTPVVAAADGRIVRLHTSTLGGLTVYQLGPDGRYVYYYAHLDAYADSLEAGQAVRAGDVLGTVGATGNADAAVPHLHFAIWRQRRGGSGWGGNAVNPFEALTR